MTETFAAYRIFGDATKSTSRFTRMRESELDEGDLLIETSYANIQYKDALAATGTSGVVRRFPMVGGTDVAGVVLKSGDPRHSPGDRVAVLSHGLGETHNGGYAELVRVPGSWALPIPDGLDDESAMAIGSTGLTVALVLHRLEAQGITPESGPVAVTGATGGVGSMAIDLLARRGYEVVAISGKPDAVGYLRELGASEVLPREVYTLEKRALGAGRWGAAIDNVGGDALSWLLRTTRNNGAVAAVGNTGGTEVHTSVFPFILRGVTLLGINAAIFDPQLRAELWQRLAGDLRPAHLADITQVIPFAELPSMFDRFLSSEVRGRIVVKIR
ncbi:acryloyl-CoA reductase [Amycolatopsis rhabdoformis]|uniref:Acryloyl-CoA reductase n=1 Tax=Amycolatopsis rhabdoformis TaxID=1448059 RepID=A0ABZ1IMV6_9PSEU|nr:acryloyl-CoA reductase [Amycolatopsis rhabdoformis]WSE34750.1 acryloyl-CoA reductase [Amycolatopsis rhabdoformis]